MSDPEIEPGRTPRQADLNRRLRMEQHLGQELARVRETAKAWRNGLAGLLVALTGFGLVKGRSDVGQLAAPWAVAVGLLLLAALAVGSLGAAALLRAAHGFPTWVSAAELAAPVRIEHEEARRSVRALRVGVVGTGACAMFLISAVALTWYGPAKGNPVLEVREHGTATCGEVEELRAGVLTLRTRSGSVDIPLAGADGIRAVESCSTG
ncbi:hypothetical protein [Streptomyces sp. NPDC059176]|uniref:hypothetical protein n=1 Tax=Streptomyces sp. NPDC059176 TaxID=3346758 RepID=UPI003692EAD5